MRKQHHTVTLFLSVLMTLGVNEAISDDGPKLGDPAPNFTLPLATRDTIMFSGVTLSEIVGKNNIILAFYPADWSGGCTKEMCTMRDNFNSLAEVGAQVYGVSGDYVFSHHEWAKYHNFQFPLLSDHTHDTAKMYRSYNSQTGYNLRTVYVIDKKGRIAYVDLAYKAGSPDSFDRLKKALSSLQ